jgi:hypothetical protein
MHISFLLPTLHMLDHLQACRTAKAIVAVAATSQLGMRLHEGGNQGAISKLVAATPKVFDTVALHCTSTEGRCPLCRRTPGRRLTGWIGRRNEEGDEPLPNWKEKR